MAPSIDTPTRRTLLSLGLAFAAAPAARAATAPLMFYGAQAGAETLDEGHGGGNPFASALIELLAEPDLTLGALPARLHDLTARKSDGFQNAETPSAPAPVAYRLVAPAARGRRVALVVTESIYANAGVPQLPGAARDGGRVTAALDAAGFSVRHLADPDRATLEAGLSGFAPLSRRAEAAVIYATGHGVQSGGIVHLLMPDYLPGRGEARLGERSLTVPTLAAAAQARTVNLVFWAGCRSPFTF